MCEYVCILLLESKFHSSSLHLTHPRNKTLTPPTNLSASATLLNDYPILSNTTLLCHFLSQTPPTISSMSSFSPTRTHPDAMRLFRTPLASESQPPTSKPTQNQPSLPPNPSRRDASLRPASLLHRPPTLHPPHRPPPTSAPNRARRLPPRALETSLRSVLDTVSTDSKPHTARIVAEASRRWARAELDTETGAERRGGCSLGPEVETPVRDSGRGQSLISCIKSSKHRPVAHHH